MPIYKIQAIKMLQHANIFFSFSEGDSTNCAQSLRKWIHLKNPELTGLIKPNSAGKSILYLLEYLFQISSLSLNLSDNLTT